MHRRSRNECTCQVRRTKGNVITEGKWRQRSGHSRTPVPPPASPHINERMHLSRIFADLEFGWKWRTSRIVKSTSHLFYHVSISPFACGKSVGLSSYISCCNLYNKFHLWGLCWCLEVLLVSCSSEVVLNSTCNAHYIHLLLIFVLFPCTNQF